MTTEIPLKEWNSEKGKMEDTTLPHWQEYYKRLKAFNEMMAERIPKYDDYADEDSYNGAIREWQKECSMSAPNKPGYTYANNH